MGEITSTGANSFEISTDEGSKTVYMSVCSRIFQIGDAVNQIVLKAVTFADNLYISSAIIYEWSPHKPSSNSLYHYFKVWFYKVEFNIIEK